MGKAKKPVNFIRQIIQNDLNKGKHTEVVTRFPPEPNGYLHIGHAKSICLNFSIANDFEGQCNLRFDDTNPEKEDEEYVQAIQADVEWLGFEWAGTVRHSSDYFQALYDYAVELIDKDLAYVDSQDAQSMREMRGTLKEPGTNSPFRDRSIEENRQLFEGMKNGDFAEGQHILRAKIDMASPNINMRDPALYRVRKVNHQRTGDEWCIYPMYDYTHCISDAIEGVTHSLCTLEFQDHRPLYDWVLDNISINCHPQQIEFSRLNLDYTVMSKRLLTQLVSEKLVNGWDDPRMPTISGLRRRGYTASSVRDFADRVGVTKKENLVELSYLESCLREELDASSKRVMGVLNPLKVVITNYPDAQSENLPARNHPKDESMGSREIPFSSTLYIERDDFMQDPPENFFRLGLGREVRLRYAYYITCTDVITDDNGEVSEVHCTYDPETKGGKSADGRKIRGTIHWVSAEHALNAEVRIYDRLFSTARPLADKETDFRELINPDSLKVLHNCKLEPSLAETQPEERIQFERLGYFTADVIDHTKEKPVFNRIVTLRDSWAKMKGTG